MIEKNIDRIGSEGITKTDENFLFVSHLKHFPVDCSEFDDVLRQAVQEVSSVIECTECGNCCRVLQPLLTDPDITRFVKGLDVSEDEFKAAYLSWSEDREGHCFKEKPCPFLKDNRCSNYENRPEDCRSYPHLDSPDQLYRMWKTVYQCSICPIVYNVCERLKERFW